MQHVVGFWPKRAADHSFYIVPDQEFSRADARPATKLRRRISDRLLLAGVVFRFST